MLSYFQKTNVRQIANQVLNMVTVAVSAFMIYKSMSLVLNIDNPIVVVLSGSMEPAFHRGDLLFLTLPRNEPVEVNDICVFRLPERPVPIVHRVVKIHKDAITKKEYILTKGDNNAVDDRGLYDKGQMWIHKEHVIGKVKGFIPYIGTITLVTNDYPWIKYTLISILGLIALAQRE